MKRIVFILSSLIILCALTTAQYSVNKKKYDFKAYSYEHGDPHRPVVAGISSYFIPGLGQMICGEGLRGAAFLGGWAGSGIIVGIGAQKISVAIGREQEAYHGEGLGVLLLGLGSFITVNIWSIVDAVQVAKVNNLVWRDTHNTGFNFEIQPYLNNVTLNNNYGTQAGLSIKVSF